MRSICKDLHLPSLIPPILTQFWQNLAVSPIPEKQVIFCDIHLSSNWNGWSLDCLQDLGVSERTDNRPLLILDLILTFTHISAKKRGLDWQDKRNGEKTIFPNWPFYQQLASALPTPSWEDIVHYFFSLDTLLFYSGTTFHIMLCSDKRTTCNISWLTFSPPVSSLPSGRNCSLTPQSKPTTVFGYLQCF